MSGFEIEISEQGWLGTEGESPYDLCSHGDIRLVIGGRLILPSGGRLGSYAVDREGGYTISTSALALLRTLESDHSRERRVADRLILHCGMIEMLSCPIGVDWSVAHLGARVRLDEVVRYDTVDVGEAVRVPGLAVELSEGQYRHEIVAFAEQAKQPFVGIEKTPADEYEEELYDQFWREYDERLSRAIG